MSLRPRLLCTCLLALGLLGCALPKAAVPPPAAAPPLPLQWEAPLPHGASLTQLGQWWQSLGDPLLADLVAAAEAASPSIASALSRVTQSRASRTLAAAALSPTLDGVANAQSGRSQAGVPVTTSVDAGLQASWEIDLFGANHLATDAAQARLEGAQAQWHEARVSVAAETAALYFRQRACEQQTIITGMDAESRAQTARLTALSTKAGFTAPANEALARASAAEANARLTDQRSQCAQDIKALVAMTALPEPGLRQRLATAPIDLAPQASIGVTAVPAQALAQRPDLYSAERDIVAAGADVGSVDAQRYPRLSLSGRIGLVSFRASGNTDTMSTWSLGPLALSLPILDGGRRDANLQSAQARYDEAVFLYRARIRDAVREVEQALLRLQSAEQRAGDATTAEQGYRQWLAATQARHNNGLASLVELEDTRRTALNAANTLLALRSERIQSWIALYRAMGGGWTPPPPETAQAHTP